MDQPPSILPPNLFAVYSPRRQRDARVRPSGLIVRGSTLADRDELARIRWQRDGGRLSDYVARFQRDLSDIGDARDALWLTAELDRQIVGYGKISYAQPIPDAPANAAPAGHYLGGVTVDPAFRRRGIAHELTVHRLRWIAERAREAYYFVNALNCASIDLHARLGFVEVTRDFFVPGVSFTGGIGILFRVDLSRGPADE